MLLEELIRGCDIGDLLDAFAERVAQRLASAASPRNAFYDAKVNPMKSARAFLNAARRGAFPSYRVGRKVLALASDVDGWILRRTRTIRKASAVETSDRDLLEGAGVRLTSRRSA